MTLGNTELILIIFIIILVIWLLHRSHKKHHDDDTKIPCAVCPTSCSPPATPQIDSASGTPLLNFFWPAVAGADRYDVMIIGPTNTTILGTTSISFLLPMPPGTYTVVVIAKSGNCS